MKPTDRGFVGSPAGQKTSSDQVFDSSRKPALKDAGGGISPRPGPGPGAATGRTANETSGEAPEEVDSGKVIDWLLERRSK